MRPIERIRLFLTTVDWHKVQIRWDISDLDRILDGYPFLQYWYNNPDQRIGQVLINFGIVPNSLLIWNDEESDILLDQGVAPEDCLYWTSIYDKDSNLLDEPISRLLKDLTTDHIVAIYNHIYVENKRTLSESYNTAFNNILIKRKEYEALTVIQHILEDV